MKSNVRTCNNCKFTDCIKHKQSITSIKSIKCCNKHKFNNKNLGNVNAL